MAVEPFSPGDAEATVSQRPLSARGRDLVSQNSLTPTACEVKGHSFGSFCVTPFLISSHCPWYPGRACRACRAGLLLPLLLTPSPLVSLHADLRVRPWGRVVRSRAGRAHLPGSSASHTPGTLSLAAGHTPGASPASFLPRSLGNWGSLGGSLSPRGHYLRNPAFLLFLLFLPRVSPATCPFC